MPRVSFGTRAGGGSDYQDGSLPARTHAFDSAFTSLDELCKALQNEMKASAESLIPECCTCELSLSPSANLPLARPGIGPYSEGGDHDLPPESKTGYATYNGGGPGMLYPHATAASLLSIIDARSRQILQRAASRGIAQAIEATDGFKYSINNIWGAKDEDGLRFSYICQDSMQNKDRHANGFHKTQKHLTGDSDRGPRKPTYDCKGSVSVKFSGSRNAIYVYYRHYAIHETVAARKNPPRPPRVPRPRPPRPPIMNAGPLAGVTQVEVGGLAASLKAKPTAYLPDARPPPEAFSAQIEQHGNARSLKRKRDAGSSLPARDPDAPLSLAELLRQSASARESSSEPQTVGNATRQQPRESVAYSLPSWQAPW